MISLSYLIGSIFYSCSVVISYSQKAKLASWYFPLGMAFSTICSFLWLYVAKNSLTKEDIYLNGIYWDSMIVACYVLIPVIAFKVRMAPLNVLGVFLVIAGIALTKL